MLISGPRNTGVMGSEQGTTANALMKGQGGDHITSSGIFEVSGNVGIGTTTPSSSLHIGPNTGTLSTGLTFGTGTSGIWLLDNTVMGIKVANADRLWIRTTDFYPDSAMTLGLTNRRWTALYTAQITDTGTNVGIGTTTPAYKLDVRGEARISSSLTLDSQPIFRVENGFGANVVDVRGNGQMVLGGSSDLGLGTGLGVFTRYSLRVGALSYTDASAILQADSTTRGFLPPRTSATSLISSPAQGLITYVTGSNDGLYYYNSGSQPGWHEVLTNTGSQSITGSLSVSGPSILQGVVAINSTNISTGYALFVNGVMGASSLTLSQNLTMGENFAISNNGSQTIDIDANNDTTNAVFRVTANGTANELFRVNETGNFGIGTIVPTYKLDVSGSGNFSNNLTVTGSLTMGGSIFTSGYIGYPNNSRYLQFNDADNLVRLQGFNGIRLATYDTAGYTDVIKIDGNVAARTVQVTGSLRTSGSITILGTDRTLYTQAVTNVTADGYLYFGDGTRLGSTGGSNIHYASGYYSQAAHQFYGGSATGMTSVVDIYGGQSGKPALRASGSVYVTGSLSVRGGATLESSTTVASITSLKDFGFNVISQIPQRAFLYGRYSSNPNAAIGIGGNVRGNTAIQGFNYTNNSSTALSLQYYGGNVLIGD
jgi:hypothetical protein